MKAGANASTRGRPCSKATLINGRAWIDRDTDSDGVWTVLVVATYTPFGDQGFSLVAGQLLGTFS